MQEAVFLLLATFSAILAQTQLGDSYGEITFINDCSTYNGHLTTAHWHAGRNMICCIKNSYPTKSLRKSEEACVRYGPGFKRKVSFENYIQPGEYQHDVAIGYRFSLDDGNIRGGICNGVLITEYFVLTSAQCVYDQKVSVPVVIRAGTIDLHGEEDRVKPQNIAISETIIHPDYNPNNYDNDIALIKLAKSANFTAYVQPACIYTEIDVPARMISTGWGKLLTLAEGVSDLQFKTNVVELKNCSIEWPNYPLSDAKFCGLTGKNVCQLVAGTSAFISKDDYSRATIVGITSAGSGCSYTNPVVFTKVSSYMDWIENIVWP